MVRHRSHNLESKRRAAWGLEVASRRKRFRSERLGADVGRAVLPTTFLKTGWRPRSGAESAFCWLADASLDIMGP